MNEEKVLNFDALKKQLKIETLKRKAKAKWDKAVRVVSDNKEFFISAGVMVGGKVLKDVYRNHKLKTEENARETRIYDPRTGTYFYTKRALKKGEKLDLEKRYSSGESKGEILNEMGLLRR